MDKTQELVRPPGRKWLERVVKWRFAIRDVGCWVKMCLTPFIPFILLHGLMREGRREPVFYFTTQYNAGPNKSGGTSESNAHAQADSYSKMIAFLKRTPGVKT